MRQSASGTVEYKNIQSKQIVVQWRKFLTSASNKTSLIQFLTSERRQQKYIKKLNGKSLFVTCNEICHCINSEGCKAIPELESTQEEADTWILLHSTHAAMSGFEAVVIVSDDTDVFFYY